MATADLISHRKSPSALRRADEPSAGNVPGLSGAWGVAPDGLFSFYVRALMEVLRAPGRGPFAAVFFLVASAVHSFAHAALALTAGRCVALLAGSVRPEGVEGLSSDGLRLALQFGSVGLAAAVAKACGGVVAAHEQAKIASRVGGTLRLRVLDDWFASYRLRRPRHIDHGQYATPPCATLGLNAADGKRELRTAARGVSALTARVTEVETGLAQGLLGGGRAVAQLLPLVVALVWISPRLAMAAFSVLGPFALVLSFTRTAWRSAHTRAARDGEELLEAADEAVRHADLWVSYSAEAKARASVAQLAETLGQRFARIQGTAAAMSGANEVLAALALVLALGAAAAGWLGNVGDSGRLLAFTVCFFLAYRPIRDLTEARLAWSRASLAYADLAALGGGVDSEELPSTSVDPTSPRWELADLHVDRLVLEHGTTAPVSFVVPAGEVAVLVGATGEGKTTLVRSLLGLERPRSGEIRFGTTSLTSAPPGLVHRPFAWVPQDSALLTDTLEANVTLGADAPVDVPAVLRSLGAEALVGGTAGRRLGPGGVMVSGGERQWVAFSRALATSQPVLVLDEPTSGLDPASQREVLGVVAALRGSRSVLLVTHRPEPLALADLIVRFEGGRVTVEDGPMRRPPHEATEA